MFSLGNARFHLSDSAAASTQPRRTLARPHMAQNRVRSRRDVRGHRVDRSNLTNSCQTRAPHTRGRENSSRPARSRPPRRQDIVDSIMAAYNTVPISEEEPLVEKAMVCGSLLVNPSGITSSSEHHWRDRSLVISTPTRPSQRRRTTDAAVGVRGPAGHLEPPTPPHDERCSSAACLSNKTKKKFT